MFGRRHEKVANFEMRRSFAKDLLSSRKLRPSIKYKRREPHIESKRMAIRHGKVVLVGKGRQAFQLTDAPPTHLNTQIGYPVIAVGLSEFGRELLSTFGGMPIENTITKTLQNIYLNLRNKIRDDLIEYVPKETGHLRASYMYNLQRMRHLINQHYVVYMQVKSDVPYLQYANVMPTKPIDGKGPHLKHPPYVKNPKTGKLYNWGFRSKSILYDPRAMTNFHSFLILNARKAAKVAFTEETRKMFHQTKSQFGWANLKEFQGLFSFSSVYPYRFPANYTGYRP